MITLIYTSIATNPMSDDELVQLLEKARVNNHTLSITGMLLYQGNKFMQVLEGPDKEVEVLYEKIKKDPRHHDVLTILKRPLSRREFPTWKMGFKKLDQVNPQQMTGYSEFLIQGLQAEHFMRNPSLAYDFLLAFREKTG